MVQAGQLSELWLHWISVQYCLS